MFGCQIRAKVNGRDIVPRLFNYQDMWSCAIIQTFCSNLTFPELTSCKKLDSCLWHAASARSRLLLMADLYSTDCVRCLRSTSNWWTCVAIHTYVMHNERKTWERNDSPVVAMLFWWFVHHVSMQRPLQTLLVSYNECLESLIRQLLMIDLLLTYM